MKRMYFSAILLLLLITLLAIVYFVMFRNSIKTYEGVYTQANNVTDFKPCGTNEHWWLSFDESAGNIDSMYEATISSSTRKTFIRIAGKDEHSHSKGHVGYYDRNFEVTKIDTLRTLLRKDCR